MLMQLRWVHSGGSQLFTQWWLCTLLRHGLYDIPIMSLGSRTSLGLPMRSTRAGLGDSHPLESPSSSPNLKDASNSDRWGSG